MHLKHILKDMKKVTLPSAGWYAFTLLLFSGFLVFEVARMSYAQTAFKYPTALPPGDNPAVETEGGGTVAYDECAQGLFVGFSSTKYDSSIQGYVTANAACSKTNGIEGSHVCGSSEILKTIQCGKDAITGEIIPFRNVDAQKGITVAGSLGSAVKAVNDCVGWTDVTSNALGGIWKFNKVTGGNGLSTTCDVLNNSRFFACCK